MKKKQVVSGLLSAAMIMNVALVDMGPVQAATQMNLARGCSVVASNVEDANHGAEKAVDGKMDTWWGTAKDKHLNENIEVTLKKPTKVKQVKVFFERTDSESNIKKFKVELKKADGTYQVIKEDVDDAKAKQEITIDIEQPVETTKVKVTVMEADGGKNNWKNIGVREIEVYGEESDIEATENKNHMKTATITVSSQETNDLGPDKLKDGKLGKPNRWASAAHTYQNQWVKAELAKPTMVKEVKFNLFERDVNPMPSNIKAFDLKYTDLNDKEHTVRINNTKENNKKGYTTELKHIFTEPVCIKKMELSGFDVEVAITGDNGYNNISIEEIELYSNQQTQPPTENTLDSVIAGLKGGTVEKDATKFTLPTVPEGFTIKINGADFEQIIAKDGKVQHPLTDKLVKVSFEVADSKENKKVTGDYDYTVKGLHETVEGKNAKPRMVF